MKAAFLLKQNWVGVGRIVVGEVGYEKLFTTLKYQYYYVKKLKWMGTDSLLTQNHVERLRHFCHFLDKSISHRIFFLFEDNPSLDQSNQVCSSVIFYACERLSRVQNSTAHLLRQIIRFVFVIECVSMISQTTID
jgi:hypothetical protein